MRLLSESNLDSIKNKKSLNQFQNELSKEKTVTVDAESPVPPPVFFQTTTPPEPFKPQEPESTKIPPPFNPDDTVQQSKFRTYTFLFLALIPLATIVTDLISKLMPPNTEALSTEVVNIIGEAVEAESNKQIDEAIQHYIRALKQLDSEGSEHITPCYTSCCVRIAELYEHQKQFGKAILIYKELADCYLNAFTHRDDFESLVRDESFDFAILRSLTIAIRYATLLPEEEIDSAKEVLMFNIVEAQKRIIESYPPFLSILNDINNRNILDILSNELEKSISHLSESEQKQKIAENSANPIELPLFTTEQTPENKLLGLHVKAWPVFTRVLINAKDLYSNLSIESDDLSSAISNLTSNSVIIQRCFDHPSRLTLTLTKLGVSLQMAYQKINMDFPHGKEIEIMQDNKLVKVDLSSSDLKNFVLNSTVTDSRRIFLKVLTLCDTMKRQESLIKANHLGQNVGEWEAMFKPALEKSEMVSATSLGMLSHQAGNNAEALKYFKRAKVLAYKLKDNDYIEDINAWISLIDSIN